MPVPVNPTNISETLICIVCGTRFNTAQNQFKLTKPEYVLCESCAYNWV